MNLKLLSLVLWAALPAAAQEKWQAGLGLNYLFNNRSPTVTSLATGESSVLQRQKKVAPALDAGYRFWESGPVHLAGTVEVQFPTTFTHAASGEDDGVDVKTWFIAPGVEFGRNLGVVDFTAGLQYRFEQMKLTSVSDQPTTSNNRFWLSGEASHAWDPGGGVKPYVGVRLGLALTQTSVPSQVATVDDLKTLGKSMEGNWEVSVRGGVRF